jgi:hypothetical protein
VYVEGKRKRKGKGRGKGKRKGKRGKGKRRAHTHHPSFFDCLQKCPDLKKYLRPVAKHLLFGHEQYIGLLSHLYALISPIDGPMRLKIVDLAKELGFSVTDKPYDFFVCRFGKEVGFFRNRQTM